MTLPSSYPPLLWTFLGLGAYSETDFSDMESIMREHVELFRTTVGNVILPAAILDPSLRESRIRGAVVVGVAITFAVLVVSVAVAQKNAAAVRNFIAGNKGA